MKMRKFMLVALATATFTFVSCQKEQFADNEMRYEQTLEADIEQSFMGTKVEFGEKAGNSIPLLWSDRDMITVVDTRGAAQNFRLIEGKGTTEGTFKIGYGQDTLKEVKYAIHPSQSIPFSFDAVKFNDRQSYMSRYDFYKSAATLVAKKVNGKLTFQPLFGIVQLHLTGEEGTLIRNIRIKSEDYLSGYAKVNPETLDLEFYTRTINGREYAPTKFINVMINSKTDQALSATEKVINIIVPPTKSNQFTIEITTTDGKIMTQTTKASDKNIIRKGMIKVMPVLKFEGKYPSYIVNGVDYGEGINVNGVTWAPVNCGYEKSTYPAGKLYQWSRMDGQGYDSKTAEPIAFGEKPLADTFYKGDSLSSGYCWMKIAPNGESRNALGYKWPEDRGEKGIGNPCPEGWKIPSQYELRYLSENRSEWTEVNGQYGYWFSGHKAYTPEMAERIFLPAAGFRDYTGAAKEKNEYGYYWSYNVKTVHGIGTFAFHLKFNKLSPKGQIVPSHEGGEEANGMFVRCIYAY